MEDIWNGLNTAKPNEICDALGWWSHSLGNDGSSLVGAVMTLCRFVDGQQREIHQLQERIKALEEGAEQ